MSPLFTGSVLGLALLAGALRCLAADGNTTVAASAPSTNAASPTPPAKGLHFADAPVTGRQIVADGLAMLWKNYPLPAGGKAEIKPPLAMYRLTDMAKLIAGGSLETTATLTAYA